MCAARFSDNRETKEDLFATLEVHARADEASFLTWDLQHCELALVCFEELNIPPPPPPPLVCVFSRLSNIQNLRPLSPTSPPHSPLLSPVLPPPLRIGTAVRFLFRTWSVFFFPIACFLALFCVCYVDKGYSSLRGKE